MSLYKFVKTRRHREGGQTLLMFVFFLVLLIVFAGLGIDLGFAYITKAELSKAVDSAALAGMLNFSQGTLTAQSVARSTFNANYQKSGRDVATVTPSITFSNDPVNGNNYINVSASSQINTFFIRVLPSIGGANWNTLSVGANAQATRSKLVISLVLDRSGSMGSLPTDNPAGSGGGQYLPEAVTDFVSLFDDSQDRMAMVSFSSTANIDVPMNQLGQPFKSAIASAASNLVFRGGTFSVGGLTNGFALNNNVSVPVGQNVNRAVVFFTDGLANMIQQTLSCGVTLNFGGYDSPNTYVAFWDPNTPETSIIQSAQVCTVIDNNPIPSSPYCASSFGCSASQFVSTQNNANEPFTRANVTAEARYQAIQVAVQMRNQGIYVFAVGLSSDPNDIIPPDFLQEVANDPSSPTYDESNHPGLALITSDPTQLDAIFKQIAETILLRLTQ